MVCSGYLKKLQLRSQQGLQSSESLTGVGSTSKVTDLYGYWQEASVSHSWASAPTHHKPTHSMTTGFPQRD